jgi:hypothetical protein
VSNNKDKVLGGMGTSFYFYIFINILSRGMKETGLIRIFFILIILHVIFPYLLEDVLKVEAG